jgi:hypothetical protein
MKNCSDDTPSAQSSQNNNGSEISSQMILHTDTQEYPAFLPLKPFEDSSFDAQEVYLPFDFDFETFKSYARSDEKEKRESAARKCMAAIDRIDDESDFDDYICILEELLADTDDVQLITLQEIKNVFLELQKRPSFFEQANHRLPALITQALDFSPKVQTAAIHALTLLLDHNLLMIDVLLESIIPSLFDYVIDQGNAYEQHECDKPEQWFVCRVNVVMILCKIAGLLVQLPKQWVFEEFVPPFSALFSDKNPVVRKLSIQVLGSFSRLFGQSFTEKCLVPHLERAVHDDNFRVRNVCCEVFVEVAINSSSRVRSEVLTPLFLHLLRDINKSVYHAAIQQLGAFIATFANPNKTGVELRNGKLRIYF